MAPATALKCTMGSVEAGGILPRQGRQKDRRRQNVLQRDLFNMRDKEIDRNREKCREM